VQTDKNDQTIILMLRMVNKRNGFIQSANQKELWCFLVMDSPMIVSFIQIWSKTRRNSTSSGCRVAEKWSRKKQLCESILWQSKPVKEIFEKAIGQQTYIRGSRSLNPEEMPVDDHHGGIYAPPWRKGQQLARHGFYGSLPNAYKCDKWEITDVDNILKSEAKKKRPVLAILWLPIGSGLTYR